MTNHQPNVLATDPPNTTESAIMSRALSIIGKMRLSYGPSILFLHSEMSKRCRGDIVNLARCANIKAY